MRSWRAAPSQAPTATRFHTATEVSQLEPLGPICPHPVEGQQLQAEKAQLRDATRGCGGALPLWKQLGPRRALRTDEGTQWENNRVCVVGMFSDRALLRVPVTKETTHPAQVPLHSQSSLVCSFRLLRVGGTSRKVQMLHSL